MEKIRGFLEHLATSIRDAARRRPRAALAGACIAVLLVSWVATVFFADSMLSTLPEHSRPSSPRPLTQQEILAQIREAQEINQRLRAERAAARSYAIAMQARADSLRVLEQSEQSDEDEAEARVGIAGPHARLGSGSLGDNRGASRSNVEFVPTDTQAEPTLTIRPEYPDLAIQSGTEGTVVVQALVGVDGNVQDTRILRSIPFLNTAAEQAVRRWRFRPATTDGRPVATWVSVPITFRRR